VLEYLGVEVDFPEGQTCCGQPAFNGGDWEASRKVVRHTVQVFAGDDPVVVPSGFVRGDVVSRLRRSNLKRSPIWRRSSRSAARAWELGDFIVNGLGVKTWPGRYEATVAFHRSWSLARHEKQRSGGGTAGVHRWACGSWSSAKANNAAVSAGTFAMKLPEYFVGEWAT